MTDGLKHYSVMLKECIDALKVKDNGVYFDGTLGGAGHSYQILKSANNVKLYATDLDDYALNRASERLKEFNGNFKLIKSNFKDFQKIVEENGIKGFDGIILDLGVSSFQLDDKSRGFSYLAEDEILDMRMDNTSPFSALTVVNEYSEKELAKIFFEYGEERFSNQIARKICEIRKKIGRASCR